LNSQAKKPLVKPVDPTEYRPTTKPAKPKVVPQTTPKPWVTAANSFSVLGENEFDDEDILPPIVLTETKPKPEPSEVKENWEDDTD